MKATAIEFRLRFLIHVVLYVLAFATPWNYWLHLDTVRTWQWLAAQMSHLKWASFSTGTEVILVVGIVVAVAAALLRTWGASYLGSGVVKDAAMHGNAIVAAGPYRYLRNPLYVGTFLHTLALSLLMLPSGAVFSIVLIGLFQLRLILAEESFLGAKVGDAYRVYCTLVPRLIPTLRPRVAASSVQPKWGLGVVGEIYFWGAAVSFGVLGWRYNSTLILQGVLVSLGVSLVARALVPKPEAA
ncbi:MAG: methyltransferase [Edaphobacter sp.]|uniref:methyltransferase family protein n=1 Tax=Edaphobacter sp. TaxID=1934404 RepID=UPI0023916F17|nr:methyltransferase [Edaphobacter sp.]MDE1176700.1 methyltransferase [Edaphobacter sp.]